MFTPACPIIRHRKVYSLCGQGKERMMNINNIREKATCINNVHESCYRSYHILSYVMWYLREHEQINHTGFIRDIVTYLSEGEKEEILKNE